MLNENDVKDFFEDYEENIKDIAKLEGMIEALEMNIQSLEELYDIYSQIAIYAGPARDVFERIMKNQNAVNEAKDALKALKEKQTGFDKAKKDMILDAADIGRQPGQN
ncbi:MAG: hypothetical protein IKB06_02270 [Clostridia bacterium]|nr:hypothetical protein [Clostridia bacterium]